jgi:hypothetical protein
LDSHQGHSVSSSKLYLHNTEAQLSYQQALYTCASIQAASEAKRKDFRTAAEQANEAILNYLTALIEELQDVKSDFIESNQRAIEAIDQREAANISRALAKVGQINIKKQDA